MRENMTGEIENLKQKIRHLDKMCGDSGFPCVFCHEGKAKQEKAKKVSSEKSPEIGDEISVDAIGPYERTIDKHTVALHTVRGERVQMVCRSDYDIIGRGSTGDTFYTHLPQV